MDLREIGWEGVEWINVDQDRDQWRAVVNSVINLRVPEDGEFLDCVIIRSSTYSLLDVVS
jgi:hypothetical protein